MRFPMIAQPRTGTMLLRTLLNQHNGIYVYGEIFYPEFFIWGFFSHLMPAVSRDANNLLPTNWRTHVTDYLTNLTGIMADAGKSIVGFDLKIPQISLVPDFHASVENSNFSVLHVRRKNSLAAILSYETMRIRMAAGASAHPVAQPENICCARGSRLANATHCRIRNTGPMDQPYLLWKKLPRTVVRRFRFARCLGQCML
jgi:hypothetical protein